MKPEDLLEPEKLPEDLRWVVTRFRLHPDDPVFLLIAWHWNRMRAGEDALRAALVELKAAVDGRIQALAKAAETVAGTNEALEQLKASLAQMPQELGEKFEAQVREPLGSALAQAQALEKSLTPLARNFHAAQHRQILAALVTGVALGALGAVVLLWA